jgi:putative copper resistance protein D
MTPHQALVLDRFLVDTTLAFSWGGGGFALLADDGARSRLLTIIRYPLLASSSVCAIVAIATLPAQTAEIASGWSSANQEDVLVTVASHTNIGIISTIQAITALALFGATLLRFNLLAVGLAGLALCETAGRGHIAADGLTVLGGAPIIVQMIHVLSAAAWVAALVPFIVLVGISNSVELRSSAVASMQRFSRAGHLAVALVLLSGTANTLLILGHLPYDLTSRYQIELLLKIAVTLAMTCFAVANRYIVVPLHRRHPVESKRLLILGASAEVALGAVALGLVASLGLENPNT